MKRIISLLLILALLPACLAVPVLADEAASSDGWIELLDYTTVDNSWNNFFELYNSRTVSLGLPGLRIVGHVNILLYSTQPITSAYVLDGSGAVFNFTVLKVGDSLYRIYGDMHQYAYSTIPLTLTTGTDSVSYCELLSFRCTSTTYNSFSTSVKGFGSALGQTTKSLYVNYPDGPTLSSWDYIDASDYYYLDLNGQFTVQFTFDDWRKYDVLELQLGFICEDINSVAGYFGNEVLEIVVTPFDNSTWNGQYLIFVTMDISKLDRSSSNTPSIIVSGTGDIECTNSVVIRYASGYVKTASSNVTTFWFTRLQSWLSTGFSSIVTALTNHQNALIQSEKTQQEANRQLMNTISSNVGIWISNQTTAVTGWLSTVNTSITTFQTNVGTWFTTQTDALTSSIGSWGQSIIDSITSGADRIVDALTPDDDASGFQDKLNNSLGQLGQAGAAMDSVSRPDIGDVDLNVSARVPVSGLNGVASIVNVVYENEVLGSVMWMFFTLSLAAFVIFGRG